MPTEEFFQRDSAMQPPALTPDYKSSVLRSPRLALWSLNDSLSEVTGPVFGREELGPLDHDMILNYAGIATATTAMSRRSIRGGPTGQARG